MTIYEFKRTGRTRRKSREEIIDLGIDPYPSETFDINTNSQEIKDDFDEKKKNFQDVSISGRIMSRRVMGSASFAEIQDSELDSDLC